jgi:hypothetical protein
VAPRGRWRAQRHTQVPSSCCCALWRMPRRREVRDRVGLNCTVKSRSSSRLAKLDGPFTKSTMCWDRSPLRPGRTSTRTTLRTSSGASLANAMVVRPPSDMPTTASASGAISRTAAATSSAFPSTLSSPSGRVRGPSEWPWPGRSTATRGRPSARATVSQVWAFCAPPCNRTTSGSPGPHTRALSFRPGSTPTSTRRTTGGPLKARPNSSAFSWKKPNSS